MTAVDPVDEWRDTVQGYQMSKTNLAFNQEPVKHVRHAEIKKLETMYNPILQQFTDSGVETHVKQQEKDSLIDTLARNKDRALRYEQTFDVINFDDKLKGLENEEGYPKPKPKDKNVVGGTKTFTDYNIISNLGFNKHHYLPPDERPAPPKEEKKINKKVTTTGLRDYNIITNRYLELHDDKVVVDKEIERLNAAKKYWKTHDFNPVNIEYYDPDKEKGYQDEKVELEKTHGQDWVQKLPKSWKEEGGLYNPINGKIEDEERLWERDLKEKNKRKRFELRYDMERQARKQGMGEEERLQNIALNKVNIQRFKDTTERGFDILTNKQFDNPIDQGSKTLYQPFVKPPASTWTKIKNSSNAFDDYHPGSSGKISAKASESDHQKIEPEQVTGSLNDRVYETTHSDFEKIREVDRRSKRLMKGSQTMSNFHKTTSSKFNSTQPIKPKAEPQKSISTKEVKDISPAPAESRPAELKINRETNQSALRRSSNYSGRMSQKSGVGNSTTSRAGKNIVAATPKSKSSAVLSSGRAIRTGAFQRIQS